MNNNSTNDFSGFDGLFYGDIKETNDLATTEFSSRFNRRRNNARIEIFPPKTPIDILASKALDELSDQLNRLKDLPSQDDLLDKSIAQLIKDIGLVDEPTNNLKKKLQSDGLTGELILATQQLNISLGNEDRHILSRSGILMYAAYRTAVGLEVEDIDGIISNILSSIPIIRSHVNQVIVDAVIEQQNLDVNDDDTEALKERVQDFHFSYAVGQVVTKVLEGLEKVRSGAQLLDLVYQFLGDSNVELPYGVDVDVIADNMVNYLVDLGYAPDNDLEAFIKQEVEEAEARINNEVDGKIDTAKTELRKEIDDNHNDLITRLTAVDQKVSDAKTVLEDQIKEERAELDGEINTVKGNIQDINGKLGEAEGGLANMSDKVGTTETNLLDLTAKVGTVDGSLSNTNEQLKTAESNLLNLTNKVGTIEGTVSSLTDKVADAGENLARLNGEIEDLKEKVDALEGNLDTSINALRRELTDKYQEDKDNLTNHLLGKIDDAKKDLKTQYYTEIKNIKEQQSSLEDVVKTLEKEAREDHLQAIEGIGPKSEETLKKKGIRTFAQLAAISAADLKKALPRLRAGYEYDDIILQAEYIVQWKVEELVNLKNSLPRSRD